VNASVYNDENFSFWQDTRTSTFLQPQISLRGQVGDVDDDDVLLYEIRVRLVPVRTDLIMDSTVSRLWS
jgi:hypothetical protein